MSLSNEHVGSKIPAKAIPICSPEQKYFSLFAMRYPVRDIFLLSEEAEMGPRYVRRQE